MNLYLFTLWLCVASMIDTVLANDHYSIHGNISVVSVASHFSNVSTSTSDITSTTTKLFSTSSSQALSMSLIRSQSNSTFPATSMTVDSWSKSFVGPPVVTAHSQALPRPQSNASYVIRNSSDNNAAGSSILSTLYPMQSLSNTTEIISTKTANLRTASPVAPWPATNTTTTSGTSATSSASNSTTTKVIPFLRPQLKQAAKAKASRAVFAHYMVGTITEDHAHRDIDDAKAMGLDGFVLNVGDATQPFVEATLHYLFGYAEYVGGFYLYISMDVYASGSSCYAGSSSCNGPFDYASIFTWTLGSSAYYKGPNGFPMISTFSSGGFPNTVWTNWKKSLANQMYFIPDFDETDGYYGGANSYAGWYYYWGDVTDGLFSWESAWPIRGTPNPGTVGGLYPGDVGPDITVQTGALKYNKGYMMGLSSHQYKDSYGANVYRQGDSNLPARMANILSMATAPDWVVIQTWNDGPESHYIGNLWPEQNTDAQPGAYMGESWLHTAWQPLIQSFIGAYKAGGSQTTMYPTASGSYIQGAIWYRTVFSAAKCLNDDGKFDSKIGNQQYYEKPDGFNSAQDNLNWAILVPHGAVGYTIKLYSNGKLLMSKGLSSGLNYGSVGQLDSGSQTALITDPNGSTYMVASGGVCLASGCPQFIYNMNYQVIPFTVGVSVMACSSLSANVYVPPSIWTQPNPRVQALPPAAIILPPYPLGHTTVISWPPYRTSLWLSSAGQTYTKTTEISIPATTVSQVPFWRISLQDTETAATTIFPLQSFMPPSVILTIPATEATFAPVPLGSEPMPPSFFQSQHPITIQPQATISVSLTSVTIPSLVYFSAAPTALCVIGCGTDSCAQFGGCNSGGSGSMSGDCGAYGCAGGCGIQGCDTSCGLACSTDQDAAQNEAENQPLPVDYDGPDNTNSGSGYTHISLPITNRCISIISSVVQSVNRVVNDLVQDLTNTGKQTAVVNTVNSGVNVIQNQMKNLAAAYTSAFPGTDRSESINSMFRYLLSNLDSISSSVTNNPSNTATNIQSLANNAATEAQSLSKPLLQDAGVDVCGPGAAVVKRWTHRIIGRVPPPTCGPTYTGYVGDPMNESDMPDEVDCVSKTTVNPYTKSQIIDAMKQGVKYIKSAHPALNIIHDFSTKGMYPHIYGNSDHIGFESDCTVENSGDVWDPNLMEFPILKDGTILSAGRGSRVDIGTDRVVFRVQVATSTYLYCGVMTHYTEIGKLIKVSNPDPNIPDYVKVVLPFKLC